MKIVLTLLVRDEEDIIEEHIRYHASVGIDAFIVTDNRSVDRTRQILLKVAKCVDLTLRTEPSDTYDQGAWVTGMAALAWQRGADWVIHSDADEFWWASSCALKSFLATVPRSINCIRVARRDFAPVSGTEPFWARQIFRRRHAVDVFGGPLPPKVMHRAHPDAVVIQGNHSVEGFAIQAVDARDLEIFHFPMRTFEQFERKIRNGGAAYERNQALDINFGTGWRFLYRLARAGRLQDYFDANAVSSATVDAALESGALVRDSRLAAYMKALLAKPAATSVECS